MDGMRGVESRCQGVHGRRIYVVNGEESVGVVNQKLVRGPLAVEQVEKMQNGTVEGHTKRFEDRPVNLFCHIVSDVHLFAEIEHACAFTQLKYGNPLTVSTLTTSHWIEPLLNQREHTLGPRLSMNSSRSSLEFVVLASVLNLRRRWISDCVRVRRVFCDCMKA